MALHLAPTYWEFPENILGGKEAGKKSVKGWKNAISFQTSWRNSRWSLFATPTVVMMTVIFERDQNATNKAAFLAFPEFSTYRLGHIWVSN